MTIVKGKTGIVSDMLKIWSTLIQTLKLILVKSKRIEAMLMLILFL